MIRLLGFCKMKENKGYVLYCAEAGHENMYGERVSTYFFFDGKFDEDILIDLVGEEIDIIFGCGFNGKAVVKSVRGV